MKIAFCLYGQPRNYIQGYNNIMNFKNKFNLTLDFYFHTWVSNERYECSPWRDINENELQPNKFVVAELIRLYEPKAYCSDMAKKFDDTDVKDTLAYRNSSDKEKANINNLLSQLYSRYRVKNLVNDNAHLYGNYDIVILSRFDFLNEINLDPNTVDTEKIYVSDMHKDRHVFPDNFMIMSQDNFIKLFNIYDELAPIINRYYIEIKMEELNEKIKLNMEEIILASCIYFYEEDNIIRTDLIPNFM